MRVPPRREPSSSPPTARARGIRRHLRLLLALALLTTTTGFEWEGQLVRLRQQYETGGTAERLEAVRRLGREGGGAAVLVAALEDPSREVRLAAAEAAGQTRVVEAVPVLLSWLTASDARSRAVAALALGMMGDPSHVPALVRVLGDTESMVRLAAVQGLSRLGGREVVTPIAGRLDDSDARVRTEAAGALGRLGDTSAVPLLAARAGDDAPEVRVAVVQALGRIADPGGLGALERAFDDDSETVRLAAVAAAGNIESPLAIEALRARVRADGGRVARAAVIALARIDLHEALPSLIDAFTIPGARDAGITALAEAAGAGAPAEDAELVTNALLERIERASDPAIILGATAVLRRVLDERAVPSAAPALVRALRVGAVPPMMVLPLLSRTGSDDALEALLDALEDESAAVRAVALDELAVYLERHGADGRATDPLLASVERNAPLDAAKLVRVLGLARSARAVPALLAYAESAPEPVRERAIEALGRIGDAAAAPTLLASLDDESARIRHQAALALASTATKAEVAALVARIDDVAPFDRHAAFDALGPALARLERASALPTLVRERVRAALGRWSAAPDVSLASRALDVIATHRDPETLPFVLAALSSRAPALRRQAAFVLGLLDVPAAASRHRALLEEPDASLRTMALASAGEHGDASLVPTLITAVTRGRWPEPAAASFALVRLARRGVLDPRADADLCRAMAVRDPIARANLWVARTALGLGPCSGVTPTRDLAPTEPLLTSATVRALRLAGHAASTEPTCAAATATWVLEACRAAPLPSLGARADVTAFEAHGENVLRDRLVALRFADGSLLPLYTTPNGRITLDAVPEGSMTLVDPALVVFGPG